MRKHTSIIAAAAAAALLCSGCADTASSADNIEAPPTASTTTVSGSRGFGSQDNITAGSASVTTTTGSTSAETETETETSTETTTEAVTTTTTPPPTTTTPPPTTTTKATTTKTVTTTAAPKQTEPEKEPEPTAPGTKIVIDDPETRYDSYYKGATPSYLYKNAGFTAEQIDLVKNLTFVGDSICSGLKVYDWMHKDQVLAEGCAAARNIFTLHTDTNGQFWFHFGGVAYDFKTAYTKAKPKVVICSMGMNDLNMTSKEQYCANYGKLIDWMKSVTPDSKFYICSITPTNNSGFSNSRIDSFNQAMKEYLASNGKAGYLDINTGLKGKNIWGGDGIHLNSDTYGKILKLICQQMM